MTSRSRLLLVIGLSALAIAVVSAIVAWGWAVRTAPTYVGTAGRMGIVVLPPAILGMLSLVVGLRDAMRATRDGSALDGADRLLRGIALFVAILLALPFVVLTLFVVLGTGPVGLILSICALILVLAVTGWSRKRRRRRNGAPSADA